MVSFTSESTIHGVTYIFGPNRSIFTRIFWVLLFILSIFGLSHYIRLAHLKWYTEPFVIVRKNTIRRLDEFPKFAITVCPQIISQDESFSFTNLWNKMDAENKSEKFMVSEKECYQLQANSLWCSAIKDFTRAWERESNYMESKKCSLTKYLQNHSKVISTLFKSYQNTHKNIFYGDMSLIKAVIKNDDSYMKHAVKAKKVLTSYGVCSTFDLYSKSIFKDADEVYDLTNNKDPDIEWSPDSEYFSSSANHPKRIKFDDSNESKRKIAGVILLKDLHIENACSSFGNKLRVIIHQPNEIPTELHEMTSIAFKENVALKIKFKSEKSYDNFRAVNQNIRKCYYENEKDLEIFKSYSKYHCELECISRDRQNPDCQPLERPRAKNSTKPFCVSAYTDTPNPSCMWKFL